MARQPEGLPQPRERLFPVIELSQSKSSVGPVCTRYVFIAICLLAHNAFAGPPAEGADSSAEAGSGAGVFAPRNLRCYGGLEDGKTVVRNADLADDATQTTAKGCRLGAGAVARAPQSPTILAGRPVVA